MALLMMFNRGYTTHGLEKGHLGSTNLAQYNGLPRSEAELGEAECSCPP